MTRVCGERAIVSLNRLWRGGLAALWLMVITSGTPLAQSPGATITGKILFRGAVPNPTTVSVTRDADFCGAAVTVQSVVVDPQTHGVQDVVVSLAADGPLPASAQGQITIYNDKCQFVPRISVGQVGAPIEVGNHDLVMHNTHVTSENGTLMNVALVPGGKPVKKVLKQAGIHAVKCDAHKFMEGHVVVAERAYLAMTDAAGQFRLTGVPPGRRELVVWHETLGTIKKVLTIPSSGELPVMIEFGS